MLSEKFSSSTPRNKIIVSSKFENIAVLEGTKLTTFHLGITKLKCSGPLREKTVL